MAYDRLVSEFTRTCKCCRTGFLIEIRHGGQYRYCPSCRQSCMRTASQLKAKRPHRVDR